MTHRVGDLGHVRDLDPAEAVPAADSTHSLSRSWALIIRPRTYSASPSPPKVAASGSGLWGLASEIETPAVLAQAAGDVAAGKARLPRR